MINIKTLNRHIKRKCALFLILFLLLGLAPLPDGMGEGIFAWLNTGVNRVKAFVGNRVEEALAADDEEFFLITDGYQINLSDLSNAPVVQLPKPPSVMVFSLNSKAKKGGGFVPFTNASISFPVKPPLNDKNVFETNVFKATADTDPVTNTTHSITLSKKGAGAEQLVGKVTLSGGKVYNFNILVKADVHIKRDKVYVEPNTPGFKEQIFANEQREVNNLFLPQVNTEYQVKIEDYTVLMDPPNQHLFRYDGHFDWNLFEEGIEHNKIVTVDNETGNLKVVGAGYTNLEVVPKSNINNKAKSAKTRIFVPLKLSETDAAGGNYDLFGNLKKSDVLAANPAEAYTKKIYTNAFDPNDLEWEVTKNGKKVAELAEITKINDKTTNGASAVRINIKRAGEYLVTAKLRIKDKQIGTLPYTAASFRYTVPFIKKDLRLNLNVGDEFNIFNNSNMGSPKDFTYQIVDGDAFITVNQATSVITARKTGDARVKVISNANSSEFFFVDLTILDTLTLSQSGVTIPVGGTFDLTAITTDLINADAWVWESLSPTIASVDGQGISATVKGVSPGDTTVTVTHTTKGGITKKASCKVIVTAGVTGIKLVPTEEIVDVGKVVSIRAIVEPTTSQGTYLYWRSSNPKIVSVDNENEHSAVNSVTAKAPGVAVIMALNKENVILGSCTIRVKTPVKEIRLSEKILERSIEEKTHQLTATVLPAEALPGLKWTSTKPEIATVDVNGLVTFKKPGTTTIICASISDPGVMDTCDIHVKKGIAGLVLDKNEVTLSVGETYKLTAEVKPDDASDKNVVFTSLNSKVATISNTGLITARSTGMAYIMVATQDRKFQATCTVIVTQKPTGFKLSAGSLVLDIGEGYTLEGTFQPKTATETKILWSSSDQSVAKVDTKGRVIGVGVGQCIITATTGNGLTANCHVKVNKPVSSISIEPEEAEIAVGEELELEVVFDSDDVSNKDVKWKSSNTSIAKVNKKGVVTGISGGLVVITVISEENGMSASTIITVAEPVSEITLNKTFLNLGYKQKFNLIATIKNKSATKKKIKWSSSNKKIATVNKSGVVYGKKLGYVTIKAKATDGSGAEATCRVRVVRPATSMEVNHSFLSMVVGKTKKLKVKIRPKNASYRSAKFKSENTEIAIVDNKGKVTAIGAGKTKIIVSAKDGSKLKEVVSVQVREYIPASGITLSSTNLTMGVGDKQSVIYSLAPNGADDKVTWSSNNKASVRVNNKGVISAVAPGSSVITATTGSGRTATVSVTVVGLNFYRLDLEQYDSYPLSVLGEVKNISWDSSNHSIATVSGGLVVAKKAGTCNIYARVNGALLTCKVRVRNIK